MGINQVHRLLQSFDTHHAQHGAKDLFLVNLHAGLDIVKQARTQEIASFVTWHNNASAINQQGRAFRHALAHIAPHLLEMLLGHQRAHVALGVSAGADFHLGDLDLQAGNHGVGRVVAHRHHQRNGHAALATRAKSRAHQGVDGVGHIGVGHHHGVVLGAAQGLHALAVRAAGGVDVFGNGGGAHKADGFDQRVRQQRVHGFFVAVDHVEHARWQTGFERQFGNAQGA